MILALDDLTLACPDPAATAAVYGVFLGREAGQGGRFQLSNTAITLTAAADGRVGLSAATFAVADLDRAATLLGRRGLTVVRNETGGRPVATVETQGLTLHFTARFPAVPVAPEGRAGTVTGLDHVVVRTGNPDRAVALFAGRLGLDMRLDRTFADWGTRLLFFRCGDLVVEVAHDLKAGTSDRPDSLWGLSWRTSDLPAAHARLTQAGMNPSDMRKGRRPGTRVFTPREPALIVPTLILATESGQRD